MKLPILLIIFAVIAIGCGSTSATTKREGYDKNLYSCDPKTEKCDIKDPFKLFINDIEKCAQSPKPIFKKNMEGDAVYIRMFDKFDAVPTIAKMLKIYLDTLSKDYYERYKKDITKEIEEFMKSQEVEIKISPDEYYKKLFIEADMTKARVIARHDLPNRPVRTFIYCYYFNFNRYVIDHLEPKLPATFKENRKKSSEKAFQAVIKNTKYQDKFKLSKEELALILGNWRAVLNDKNSISDDREDSISTDGQNSGNLLNDDEESVF